MELQPLRFAANEIQHGLEVYCLPNLRRVEVTRVDLRNRIESARFVVVAVTMNTGAGLTAVPPVTGLPPSAKVAPVEQAAPSFASVSIGLYIEGYLCDERAACGRTNVLAHSVRARDGTSLLYPGTTTEHMMCPASTNWRSHLAGTYRRVAAELQPSGMYIDQYGFVAPWKTCWSRAHGHAVPWPPITGERDTTRAIRSAVPPDIATLTEETPNDVNSQFQDGALGYSVAFSQPALAPHRVDLFRFQFPDFKVFQLVSYNDFVEGGWDMLKYPFFNGEYCTFRGDLLRVPQVPGERFLDAFTGGQIQPHFENGWAIVPVVLGPRDVGCIVASER